MKDFDWNEAVLTMAQSLLIFYNTTFVLPVSESQKQHFFNVYFY